MFRSNTAAFVHELPEGVIANVDGAGGYVRVQVLTNAGALDRAKQLAVVERFTAIVAVAAGDASLAERTWVLLTEAVPGGWGLHGHASTNEELVAAPHTIAVAETSDSLDVSGAITPETSRLSSITRSMRDGRAVASQLSNWSGTYQFTAREVIAARTVSDVQRAVEQAAG